MKKYLKMLGFLLLYYVIGLGISYGLWKLPLLTGFFKFLGNLCPSGYYATIDPVIIIVFILIFPLLRKISLFQFASFNKIKLSTLILAGLIGFFMAMVSYSMINIDYMKNHYQSLTGTLKYFIIGGNIYMLIVTVLINSLSKEIQFRGSMFNEVRAVLPVTVAVIVSSVLYASQVKIGCDWSVTLYSFLGQILFGLIFYYGKSIWASFLAQICCTLGMALLDRTFLVKLFTPGSAIYMLILGVILVLALLITLYQKGKQPGTSSAKLEG